MGYDNLSGAVAFIRDVLTRGPSFGGQKPKRVTPKYVEKRAQFYIRLHILYYALGVPEEEFGYSEETLPENAVSLEKVISLREAIMMMPRQFAAMVCVKNHKKIMKIVPRIAVHQQVVRIMS